MRDGLGDPNFLNHNAIDPELALAWKTVNLHRPLNRNSRSLASMLAYELPGT